MAGDLVTVSLEGSDDDVSVARLKGEIDLSNAASVERALVSGASRSRTLILDLSELAYLDSAGVALLHRLARTRLDEGRSLAVVVTEGSFVRRVLEVTRLDTVVPVAPTVDDALAAAA